MKKPLTIEKKIISGCEELTLSGNSIGCLLIHGFRSCPFEMIEYARYLNKQGFTVFTCLLPGHGTKPEDLLHVKWENWLNYVEEKLKSLKETCSKIFIGGLSTGGSLALYLSTLQKVDGVIALAPGLILLQRHAKLSHILKYFWKFKNIKSAPDVSIKVESIVYPKVPVHIISELLNLYNSLNKKLTTITAPALIIYSPKDHVVNPKSSIKIYDKISSSNKKLVVLKDSYHILTMDVEKKRVFNETVKFINNTMTD